jgi:hypothetical protein
LVQDKQEEITSIEWTLQGKVKKINRIASSTKADLEFSYYASGNRVVKKVKPRPGGSPSNQDVWDYTYYVRDAQGNVLTTYERDLEIVLANTVSDKLKIEENSIYGSSRLGVEKRNGLLLSTYEFTYSQINNGVYIQNANISDSLAHNCSLTGDGDRIIGYKNYELANHLGNVLEVINDRKIPFAQAGSPGILDYYLADVKSYSDYYPFGMQMSRRKSASSDYKVGAFGHEKDDEVKGNGNHYSFNDYGLDVRTGRRWNIDPQDQPGLSPYAVFNNNPIYYTDPDGESPISVFAKMAAKAGLKKAAKELVEAQIKKRLSNYMGNKWAKQLADDALSAIDMATASAWWEYAIEVVPIVGDIYGGAQLTKQGLKVYNLVQRFENRASAIANTLGKVGNLRSALKLTDNAFQAHHIIPTQLLKESDVVQDAVAAGFKFNDEINGIAVKAVSAGGQHAKHDNYTKQIFKKLDEWKTSNPEYTPGQAKEFLEDFTGQLKQQIQKESVEGGKKVNDLIIQ